MCGSFSVKFVWRHRSKHRIKATSADLPGEFWPVFSKLPVMAQRACTGLCSTNILSSAGWLLHKCHHILSIAPVLTALRFSAVQPTNKPLVLQSLNNTACQNNCLGTMGFSCAVKWEISFSFSLCFFHYCNLVALGQVSFHTPSVWLTIFTLQYQVRTQCMSWVRWSINLVQYLLSLMPVPDALANWARQKACFHGTCSGDRFQFQLCIHLMEDESFSKPQWVLNRLRESPQHSITVPGTQE